MLYTVMNAEEFRKGLAEVGLSQLAFARLVSAAPRSVRSWALAENRVPSTVAILLRLLAARKITVKQLQQAAMQPLAQGS